MVHINARDYLAEWITRFVRNKDLIVRKIEEISKKEELIIAKLKEGKEHAYLVEPFLDNIDSALGKLKKYEHSSLIVYNTNGNFEIVLKNWEKLAKFSRHFSIHFVNPFSKTEKRWAIYPMTHDLVTEKAGLKQGLTALFMTVEATTKEEIERVIKENGR